MTPDQICETVIGRACTECVEQGAAPDKVEQTLIGVAVGNMIDRVGSLAALGWLRSAAVSAINAGASPSEIETLAVALIGAANGGPAGIGGALDRLATRERENPAAPPKPALN